MNRRRICITCRTLYDANEECRGKKHRTVDLGALHGRQALDDEVWGPDSRARAMRQAAKAGAGGGAAGGLFDACSGCGPFDACDALPSGTAGGEGLLVLLAGIVVVVIGAIVGIVLYWVIRAIVNFAREKLRKPVPHGAFQAAPKLKRTVQSAGGVVRGGQRVDVPWREQSAYAWAMELHRQRVLGGGAMLRDAESAGFSMMLDDGRMVRIPPGRIRVVSNLERVDADVGRLKAHVRVLEEAGAGAERTVFPFDFARGTLVEEGDRVEVLGELAPDPEAQGGAFRVNAGGFVPVGVPYLRVEKPNRTRIAADPPARPGIGGVEEYEPEPIEEERKAHR